MASMPQLPPSATAGAVGAVGTTLVAWGTCHPEFSHGPDGWPNATVRAVGASVPWPLDWIVIVAGVVLLCWAWWQVKDARTSTLAWLVGLWALPLLLAPPVLSADAVLYADLGWILHQGADPYTVGLTGVGGPYATQVDPLWAGSGVAYPPLALRIDQLVVTATGGAPYLGIIAMRVPAIASVAALFGLIPALARRLGRDEHRSVWFGVANPLLLLHFLGGAHNDAPMVAVALAGLLVAWWRPHWVWSLLAGPAVIGLAMAVKQQAGLAVVAAAGVPVAVRLASLPILQRLWLLGWRTAVGSVVAVATFVGVSVASGLGFGWVRWLSLMGNTGTPAPFSIVGKLGTLAITAAGGDPTGFLAAVAVLSGAVLLGAVAWLLIRFADRPLEATAWASLAVSVLGQSLHPWYLPWSLALFALVRLSVRQRDWVLGFAVAFVIWNSIQTVVWHSMP